MKPLACRSCGTELHDVFADLGTSPMSNAFLQREQLAQMEPFYPLVAYVCRSCFLVQLREYEAPRQIFDEYAYFSSYSSTWLDHARRFARASIDRWKLSRSSTVIEVASNDGYLLQYFREAGVGVTGIEPAANVAKEAERKGVRTLVRYLGAQSARDIVSQVGQADLVVGNNVLAHVPDLNDFAAGLAVLLKPDGVLSLEFPHLLRLMDDVQFDTIYHEHFSYFSLIAASAALARQGLDVFDVEELATHGGSLRVYAAHSARAAARMTENPDALVKRERLAGLERMETYSSFGRKVQAVKRSLLKCLIGIRENGESVAGYGAPAKGNTLLNYCGVRTDLLDYTVDRNPYKQGLYLPGSRVPVYAPERISETRPDYVLILPWNIRDEVIGQLEYVRRWGGRFLIPIPRVEVLA